MNIYQITEKYQGAISNVEAILDETAGELTPEAEAAILEVTAVAEEFDGRAESFALAIKNLEAQERALAIALEELSARKNRIGARIDRWKKILVGSMIHLDRMKIKTATMSIAAVRGPEKVEITDEAKLPPFVKKTPEPPPPRVDKNLVKQWIQDCLAEGKTHEGARILEGVYYPKITI